MSHDEAHKQRLAQFTAAVATLSPAQILAAAEAAGNADAAVIAIAALVGFPVPGATWPPPAGSVRGRERFWLNQIILARLTSLRPIAQAGGFNWYY